MFVENLLSSAGDSVAQLFAGPLALGALAFALTYLIHSTLLLGTACLLARRVAKGSLRTREWLWKVALFGGLATSALQVGLGWRTPLAHWTLAPQAEVAAAPERSPVALPEPESPPAPAPLAANEPNGLTSTLAGASLALGELLVESALLSAEPELAHTELAAEAQPQPVAAPARDAGGPAAWRAWLTRVWFSGVFALWLGFAVLVAALFAWMWYALERRLRGGHELTGGELRRLLDSLAVRRVRLVVAPRLRTPVSFGWWRGTICVPPRALNELSAEEQESMLAHELAHLERRDPLWLSLAWFVERVFFFQPLNRVARAELIDLAELLCDDSAARRTGNRVALASCLARIASWIVGPERALPATSMAEAHGRSRLGQRIERLLDDSIPHETGERRRLLNVGLGLGLASAVLVAPGVASAGFEALDVPREHALALETGELWRETCELAEDVQCDVDEHESLPSSAEEQPAPDAPTAAVDPLSGRANLAVVVDASGEFAAEFAALDEAVRLLEAEIAELRVALEELDLGDDLTAVVDELEERAERLSRRRIRFARLTEPLSLAGQRISLGTAAQAPLTPDVR